MFVTLRKLSQVNTNAQTLPYLLRERVKALSRHSAHDPTPKATVQGWKLLADVEKFLSQESIPARELSILAWSVSKLGIADPSIWQSILARSQATPTSVGDTAVILFSVSTIFAKDPTILDVKTLESTLSHITTLNPNHCALCDTAQLCYFISTVFPKSLAIRPFLSSAITQLDNLPRSNDSAELPQLKSCREICLLWSVARSLKKGSKSTTALVASLLEASRGLRLCPDFNQNKAGQLAETLAHLNQADPRGVFPIIHYIDHHHKTINRKNLLRIIRSFSKLGVDNQVVWKRIANRMEDEIGLQFTVSELEEIRNHFTKTLKVGSSNNRIYGIIGLYIKTKNDAQIYGPS